MFNKSIFLIITFISHTLSLSSQIVNVDSKRQSEEKGLSGIVRTNLVYRSRDSKGRVDQEYSCLEVNFSR